MQANASSEIVSIMPIGSKIPGQIAQESADSTKDKAKPGKGLKRRVEEEVYNAALLVVDMIDTDLTRETRHYRTKAGQLLITLDQVIRAARKRNLLITVPGDTIFQVPPDFARCPYCEGRLYAGFRGWVLEEDGTWAGEEVELDCENEPDMETNEAAWDYWLETHSEMPYVYWLPVCEKVKRWINSQYRFAKGEFELPGERRESAGAGPVTAGEL